jgi:hypothetical protein
MITGFNFRLDNFTLKAGKRCAATARVRFNQRSAELKQTEFTSRTWINSMLLALTR